MLPFLKKAPGLSWKAPLSKTLPQESLLFLFLAGTVLQKGLRVH